MDAYGVDRAVLARFPQDAQRVSSLAEFGKKASAGRVRYALSPHLMLSNQCGDIDIIQVDPKKAVLVVTSITPHVGRVERQNFVYAGKLSGQFAYLYNEFRRAAASASLVGVSSANVVGPMIDQAIAFLEKEYAATFPNEAPRGTETMTMEPSPFHRDPVHMSVEWRETSPQSGALLETRVKVHLDDGLSASLESTHAGTILIRDDNGRSRITTTYDDGEMRFFTEPR